MEMWQVLGLFAGRATPCRWKVLGAQGSPQPRVPSQQRAPHHLPHLPRGSSLPLLEVRFMGIEETYRPQGRQQGVPHCGWALGPL
eukprot:11501583-Heterocapsa_arctica.AAC.1